MAASAGPLRINVEVQRQLTGLFAAQLIVRVHTLLVSLEVSPVGGLVLQASYEMRIDQGGVCVYGDCFQ